MFLCATTLPWQVLENHKVLYIALFKDKDISQNQSFRFAAKGVPPSDDRLRIERLKVQQSRVSRFTKLFSHVPILTARRRIFSVFQQMADDSVTMSNAEFQQLNSTLVMFKEERYEAIEREDKLKKGSPLPRCFLG